jgi:probable rRNA maturation factor
MPTFLNNIQDQQLTEAQERQVTAILDYGLQLFDKSAAEISLVLVNNDYIHKLNLDYRGLDQPTDVLSFALEEADGAPPPVESANTAAIPELLGDIYISVPRAAEQAVTYGHSFERELGFLAVHGLLHLMGYDHQTPEETAVMREKEEEIMQKFALERE